MRDLSFSRFLLLAGGVAILLASVVPLDAQPLPSRTQSQGIYVVDAAPSSGSVRTHGAPEVRIWAEGGSDLWQAGSQVPLRLRTSRDAHIAVVHIDTEGQVEFLFPRNPWDDDFVRGNRIYTISSWSRANRWAVGATPGMGFVYVIASPVPLDFRYFRDRRGIGWDLSEIGWGVRGDPFWTLHQITQFLIPGVGYTPYGFDFYSYHVGARHPYPAYACYDRFTHPAQRSWNPYYPSCDRVLVLLRSHPHYYDTRRYRGERLYRADRWSYLRGTAAPLPRHGFKEPGQVTAPPVRRATPGTAQRPAATGTATSRPAAPAEASERPAPASGTRVRPAPARRDPEANRPAAPARPASTSSPQVERSRPSPRGSTPQVQAPSSRPSGTAAPRARPSGH